MEGNFLDYFWQKGALGIALKAAYLVKHHASTFTRVVWGTSTYR